MQDFRIESWYLVDAHISRLLNGAILQNNEATSTASLYNDQAAAAWKLRHESEHTCLCERIHATAKALYRKHCLLTIPSDILRSSTSLIHGFMASTSVQ